MLKKLKTIIFFEKNIFIFLFLLIGSLLIAIIDMLSLLTIASLGNVLAGSSNFFYQIFGYSYNFTLKELFILAIFFFLVKNLLLIFYNLVKFKQSANLSKKVSKILFNDLLSASYQNIIKKKPSDTIRRINDDINPAVEYVFIWLDVIKDFFILIFIIFLILSTTDITQLVIFLIYGFLVYFFYIAIKNLLTKITRNYIGARTKIIALLHQTFGSLKENFIYQNNEYLISRFSNSAEFVSKFNFYSKFISQLPKILFEIFLVIGLLIFFAILSTKYMNNEYILSKIIFISVLSLRLIPLFNSISTGLMSLRIYKEIFDNILLDFQKALKNIYKNSYNKKFSTINFDKSISFKRINLKYASEKRKLIANSNFTIHKNKVIGIFGPSGSGKTTLVDQIIGLVNIQKGKILINNQIIKNKFIYKKNLVGYIPQTPFLLDDSIKNNIIFGRNNANKIDNKKIWRVIKLAKIDKYVKKLKYKENTQIGNQGIFLSGGQKQRIVIARALLLNPKILIMDEATNALDLDTEKKIINDLVLMKNKITIIIIAHSKNIIKECDIAYKIFNNKIIRIK
jgi:ABC-type bacteriocin/lantibiotic exporter with double-glycine peptidase domain